MPSDLQKVDLMTFRDIFLRFPPADYHRLLLLLLLGSVVIGCGPSRQELLMQSAQRQRDDSDDDDAPLKEVKKTPAPAPEPVEVAKKPEPATTEGPKEDEKTSQEVAEKKTLIPIQERKPEGKIPEPQRRRMALKSLETIHKALTEYKQKTGGYPLPYSEAQGFKTLSWRVKLLPYLGHKELYDKFDFNVPWNKPPNEDLVKFIPDVYVSPERWDTKTNFVLPAEGSYIFGRDGQYVRDDYKSVILLVEADDEWATPWTAPRDFTPANPDQVREGLGNVRKDGAFAMWANGWPVLLANELTGQQIHEAMRAEGSLQKMGDVHRDITIEEVSDASVAADKKPKPIVMSKTPASQPKPQISIPKKVREPVPVTSEILAAQKKLARVFQQKIDDANRDEEKLDLARELLQAAKNMPSDPAGVWALQTAAMRLAMDGGGAQELLEAIDHRVGKFEVDTYEVNMKHLLAFGEAYKSARGIDNIDGYLERTVHVVYSAIVENDFARASALLRVAYRFVDQPRNEEVPQLVNKLRSQLGVAQRFYDKAREDLADYRINPDDGEAAASFGRFLCFVKGDWENGLPLLAKGGTERLREIAQADLEGADNYLDKIALADAWWEISSLATTGIFKQSARDRALHWYSGVIQTMPESLDRMHVKARLDEARTEEPGSPLALIRKLSEQVGVDLSVGLAGIANVGQQKIRSGGGIDRDG